jgi:hypothetical protein
MKIAKIIKPYYNELCIYENKIKRKTFQVINAVDNILEK